MKRPRDEGQTTVLVLGLALVTFAVAGVAVDGSRAFLFRRALQNGADAAATAAAGELDRASYYASGGRRIELDPDAGRSTAMTILEARRLPLRHVLVHVEREVRVVLRGAVPTTFLSTVGIDEIPVAVEAVARPVRGPISGS